jgi:hypothetical protein
MLLIARNKTTKTKEVIETQSACLEECVLIESNESIRDERGLKTKTPLGNIQITQRT